VRAVRRARLHHEALPGPRVLLFGGAAVSDGEVRRVRFRGETYLLLGDPDRWPGAPLTTEALYRQGLPSFAHVSGGQVLRYHEVIGRREDLEDLGPAATPEPDEVAWRANRDAPGWRQPPRRVGPR